MFRSETVLFRFHCFDLFVWLLHRIPLHLGPNQKKIASWFNIVTDGNYYLAICSTLPDRKQSHCLYPCTNSSFKVVSFFLTRCFIDNCKCYSWCQVSSLSVFGKYGMCMIQSSLKYQWISKKSHCGTRGSTLSYYLQLTLWYSSLKGNKVQFSFLVNKYLTSLRESIHYTRSHSM